MPVPNPVDEFAYISRMFHQDVFVRYPDHQAALADYLGDMKPEQLKRLGAYLDRLMTGGHSVEELNELWETSGSDWFFYDDDILKFFKYMREQIAIRAPG